jgi:hypothetical protein
MVRLIVLLLIVSVLYLKIIKDQQPIEALGYKEPSIITVEELPPIRAENK